MKQFGAALYAQRMTDGHFYLGITFVYAGSKHEATGIALDRLKKQAPITEWANHIVEVAETPYPSAD